MAPSLRGLAKGQRAFCSWDEDSVTMAVEAARDLAHDLAGYRRDVVEVCTLDRGNPLAADEVVVVFFVLNLGACMAWGFVNHACLLVQIEWTVRV